MSTGVASSRLDLLLGRESSYLRFQMLILRHSLRLPAQHSFVSHISIGVGIECRLAPGAEGWHAAHLVALQPEASTIRW